MKRVLGLMCVAGACGLGAAPQFELGTWVEDGAGWVGVPAMSAPWVIDWDADGKKDLLLGDSGRGVYVYLNEGTDESPRFDGRQELMSGVEPIITDGGG